MGESLVDTLPDVAALRERLARLYEEIDMTNALIKAREKLERRAEIGRAARAAVGLPDGPPPRLGRPRSKPQPQPQPQP